MTNNLSIFITNVFRTEKFLIQIRIREWKINEVLMSKLSSIC
jgi:hypothetical protein